MPYWLLVTRSFRIAWNHRYLWLIALFSGEAGYAGSSYSSSYSQRQTAPTTAAPNFGNIRDQTTAWLNGHIGLIVSIAVIWLVLVIAFFILAAVCEGATIRGSAEHDADRPFSLGPAWRAGVQTMWVVVRVRLLLLLLSLPLLVLVAAWVFGLILVLIYPHAATIVLLVLSGFVLAAIWFVYGTYLFFLDRLGVRAAVLEQVMAIPALARGHRLLLKRFGRTLLVWLVSIGVSIVVGIAAGTLSALVVAPFVAAAAFATSSHSLVGAVLLLPVAIVFVAVFLVVAGFIAAQSSTYWTLAFRRLDLEVTA